MNLATGTALLNPGPVLVTGTPTSSAVAGVMRAVEQARLGRVSVAGTTREVDLWLDEHRPATIIVDAVGEAAEQACLHLRDNPMLAHVPILGLVDRVSDLAFEELFGWGGDDLAVRGNDQMLARRLRQVALAGDIPLSKRRGITVVADPDQRRRVLTARVLRNAGYGVTFALDADEAIRRASTEPVELVVSASALEPTDGHSLASRARNAGVVAPWVVACAPKETARIRGATVGQPRVAVYDAFGPPENLLFVANELMRGDVPDARASARLLYGTTVLFRAVGAEEDEIGYCYNLSGGGVYVRTLAPLARGTDAWLEMKPPRCNGRVRLEGKLVWTRGFGPNDAATVPPGFGIQISGGSTRDLERYARGYRAFAAEMLAP